MAWVTLEGYEVVHTTDGAVLLEKDADDACWVPREVLMDGDTIVKGDTDLVVQAWFAKRHGLE